MEQFLAKLGLCVLVVGVILLVKRVDDYYYFKKLHAVRCKMDEDDA